MRRAFGGAALLAACLSAAVLAQTPRPAPAASPSGDSFAAHVAALSEPGGYFDTDDLISNERSYLHVMPTLRQAGLSGTAYIGVGPDTNFSYIAATRPSIAFIIDIRRDNLLLHLLFKALFAESQTRVDYLARLVGRVPPDAAALAGWRTADIAHIVGEIEHEPAEPEAGLREMRTAIERRLKSFGVPLSTEDLATIDRFHRTFETQGLQLRLEIINRGAPVYYPTLRDLLLETDRAGKAQSYCASEDDFQFVRGLEGKDLVIPVVGDLGGTSALRNIGRTMATRGVTLGAFYTSNVEFYLFRSGTFRQFVSNVAGLPRTVNSAMVRSAFVSAVGNYVPMLPGYVSASLVASANDLVDRTNAGRIQNYLDLVVR